MRDLTVSELEWISATLNLIKKETQLEIDKIAISEYEITFYCGNIGLFETTLFQGFGDIEECEYSLEDLGLKNFCESEENNKTKYKVGDKLRFKRGNEKYWKNCIEYMHCEIINVEEDCEDELPYQIEFSTPNGNMFYWCKENALFLESEVPNNETK